MTHSIRSPQVLYLWDRGKASFYGGSQTWYQKYWQRMAGCGPTTATHLLHYLARTRRACRDLFDGNAESRQEFLTRMEECWRYVTPGLRGVNSTGMFAEGVARFGEDHGMLLDVRTLDIPAAGTKSRGEEPLRFLAEALDTDLPVAFLNLNNGRLSNLESWHWVTLVECTPESGQAIMYDQGRRVPIDLRLWLQTTSQGGGFVTARPA